MPILDNPKHEKFCQFVATGTSAQSAYGQIYNVKGRTAANSGSRLMADGGIRERVKEIQTKAEKRTVLSIEEKREYLRRVVVTPIGEIDETSDLCQHAKYTDVGREFKMPDKLKAIELDAKLAGEFKEKVEVSVDPLVEALLRIRRGDK